MLGKYWPGILICGGTKTCGTTVLSLLIQGSQYPPDLQETAVQTVLQQAEALSSGWPVSRG